MVTRAGVPAAGMLVPAPASRAAAQSPRKTVTLNPTLRPTCNAASTASSRASMPRPCSATRRSSASRCACVDRSAASCLVLRGRRRVPAQSGGQPGEPELQLLADGCWRDQRILRPNSHTAQADRIPHPPSFPSSFPWAGLGVGSNPAKHTQRWGKQGHARPLTSRRSCASRPAGGRSAQRCAPAAPRSPPPPLPAPAAAPLRRPAAPPACAAVRPCEPAGGNRGRRQRRSALKVHPAHR